MLSRVMGRFAPRDLGDGVGCAPPSSTLNSVMLQLLPAEERSQYQYLIDSIGADVQAVRRHSGLTEFVKHMWLVHRFVARGNANDSLRGIVCGVEFGRGFILVNTDRFKKVLFRSKSCMNGCFQRLGYDVMRPSHDITCLFTRLLPSVNPEFFAIRQWCVRLVGEQSSVRFMSNLPDAITGSFEPQRLRRGAGPDPVSLEGSSRHPQSKLKLIVIDTERFCLARFNGRGMACNYRVGGV